MRLPPHIGFRFSRSSGITTAAIGPFHLNVGVWGRAHNSRWDRSRITIFPRRGRDRAPRRILSPVDRIKDRNLAFVEPGGPAVLEAHGDFRAGADAPHDLREREPAAGVVEREVAVGDGVFFGV